MKVLYIRTSTVEQNSDRQKQNNDKNCKIIEDKCSGAIPFFEREGGKKILELTEKGKNFSPDEINSFYEWMKVEYKNYMMLSRDNALNTLSKLKTIYGDYVPMVEVLENNINEYGSLQSFYRASIDLTNDT